MQEEDERRHRWREFAEIETETGEVDTDELEANEVDDDEAVEASQPKAITWPEWARRRWTPNQAVRDVLHAYAAVRDAGGSLWTDGLSERSGWPMQTVTYALKWLTYRGYITAHWWKDGSSVCSHCGESTATKACRPSQPYPDLRDWAAYRPNGVDSPGAYAALCALAQRATKGRVRISYACLGKHLGCSAPTAKRYLEALVAAGLLKAHHEAGEAIEWELVRNDVIEDGGRGK